MKNLTRCLLAIVCCLSFTFCRAGNPDEATEPVNPKRIILAEQSEHQIVIADVNTNQLVWVWKAHAPQIKAEHIKWFNNPSEAKVVYGGKYVLMTASGGAVALIRIADKKVMFYALAGGNTHSAEILPDGNIVSASSHGNCLTVFKVDTLHFPDKVYKKNITITNGHNVVWDKKRNVLWSASDNELISFTYTNNCSRPDLVKEQVYPVEGRNAHDLFPVYGKDALWLTTTDNVYQVDLATKSAEKFHTDFQQGIKSVSSGPQGFPVIIQKPKEQWWTDEVIDSEGKSIFHRKGYKIYKARWVLPNGFSYSENQDIRQCD